MEFFLKVYTSNNNNLPQWRNEGVKDSIPSCHKKKKKKQKVKVAGIFVSDFHYVVLRIDLFIFYFFLVLKFTK
jgi:fructose-1,6-bisphosphatase